MRRIGALVLGLGLLLAGCSGKEAPSGPFVPLAARLPADSHLVVLADLAALGKSFEQGQQAILELPAIARNPGLKQLVEEQQSLLRTMLRVAQGKLGLDPLHDLERAALGLVVVEKGEPGVVAAVEGSFPPDLFDRLGLGPAEQTRAGVAAVTLPDTGLRLALLAAENLLVIADEAHLAAALEGGRKVPAALLETHPGLFAGTGQGFELRASFAVPTWLHTEVAGLPARPGVSTLAGIERANLNIDERVTLSVAARDEQAARNIQALLEAEAELITGGQHLARALGYWLLVLDLDAVPGLPPRLAQALSNRKALADTLAQFFPESRTPPEVSRDGLQVRLSTSPQALKGAALLVGAMAAVAVPSFIQYQQQARAARQEALERARQQMQGARP